MDSESIETIVNGMQLGVTMGIAGTAAVFGLTSALNKVYRLGDLLEKRKSLRQLYKSDEISEYPTLRNTALLFEQYQTLVPDITGKSAQGVNLYDN